MPTQIDPKTGYPPGYKPKWWRCPECEARFYDSQERQREYRLGAATGMQRTWRDGAAKRHRSSRDA